jgi:SPRY domain
MFPLPLPAAPARHTIAHSLRLRAIAGAHMTRTNVGSPTNNKICTLSFWMKFSGQSGTQNILGSDPGSPGFNLRVNAVGSSNFDLGIDDPSNGSFNLTTTRVFRDPSAWYHIVVAIDTTQGTIAHRVRLYVANLENTSWTASNWPALNARCAINEANASVAIGRRHAASATWYFDGYLAEFQFVDGQALTPSSFGKIDTVTGAWIPKRYAGTYGANGFHLPFNDAASTATLSQDRSGNANNWTPSGISVTPGDGFDQMLDSPTNGAAGTRPSGNYWTLNPLEPVSGASYSEANLRYTNGNNHQSAFAPPLPSTGKWYWETEWVTNGGGSSPIFGLAQHGYDQGANGLLGYRSGGDRFSETGSQSAYGATWAAGDIIGIAVDMDAGTLRFQKNGADQGVAFSTVLTALVQPVRPMVRVNIGGDVFRMNFGQRAFSNTPPAGFVALCTANLPTPAIPRGDDAFQTTLRSGTGGLWGVSSLRFQPETVWIKARNHATNHVLSSATHGVNKGVNPNTVDWEFGDANTLTAFNANGYSLGSDASSRGLNINTHSYVDHAWRKGAAYGHAVVLYTGNGANRTIPHALGAPPRLIFAKALNAGYDWAVYHRSLGATQHLYLNASNAAGANATFWNSEPTSNVFGVGTIATTNNNGTAYVAYLWTEIPGFSRIANYQGNGASDGTFVWCGFRPRAVLVKNITGAASWSFFNTDANPFNVAGPRTVPNMNIAEAQDGTLDILSNGFKFRENNANTNGGATSYVFAAFAETPFKFATAR